MNVRLPSFVLGAACCVASTWAATAAAAPLDLDRVAAESVWFAHFDMDAARGSIVAKRAWERASKMHPHAETMLRMVSGMTGMNPLEDLRDVTAYGLDTDKRNGVMVLRAKVNRELLQKMVEKAADHESMDHRKHTLHSWTQKGWRGRRGEKVAGAFHGEDMMVFARTPERLMAALDVLDGEAAAVDGDGPLGGRVRPGSILVARAAAVDPKTKCPVLRQGRSFRVAMGEHEGKSFYRARLDMKSEAAAEQVEDVIDGMEALARLRWGDDSAVLGLVDGVETETDGVTCIISWDAAAEDVASIVDKLADHCEQKRKEWAGRYGRKGGCPCGGDGCGADGCQGDCETCRRGDCPAMKKKHGKQDDRPLRDDEF